MKKFFILLVSIGLVAGCQLAGNKSTQNKNPKLAFFDLKGYFKKEIARLQQEHPAVDKKVAINGKSEEKSFDTLDYARELAVFINSDINRPDWTDKYSVDSVVQNGTLAELHYRALTKQLRTRQISIEFGNNEVRKISIKNGGNNNIAGSEQELTYLPREGYQIKSRQYTALLKDNNLSLEVRFGTNRQ